MPDWSYLTLFAPALRRLPGSRARDLTLSLMGGLARAPGGARLIAAFGHMNPPDAAGIDVLKLHLRSRVGISGELDPWLLGTPALGQLGVGFLEVGPVTKAPRAESVGTRLCDDGESIVLAAESASPGLARTRSRLAGYRGVPLLLRLAREDAQDLVRSLEAYAAAFVIDDGASISRLRGLTSRPLLLALAPDTPPGRLQEAAACNADGYVISGGIQREGQRLVGRAARSQAISTLRTLRTIVGSEPTIVADTGVTQPADALETLAAGADLVLLHVGLVTAGPGLPKRINEAVAVCSGDVTPPRSAPAWLPLFLLGLSMLLGGALAWLIAATRVVLPYDEAFLGLDRDALPSINARLLAFMAHDRVTLAGTMLSIGVLYSGLALGGIRRGAHWAWQVTMISAGVGFASFFLFLGFGYFDPLHAAVSVVLFLMYLWGAIGAPRRGQSGHASPDLYNTPAWRRGLWGQLCFVALGLGLIGAGIVIAIVGIRGVLVPEDVRFLDAPSAVLRAANPRLLPLVAHDRAGFGGALVSDGLGVLLASMWGFREGARWLWLTLLGSGSVGFVAALGVHFAVGYLDLVHLAPAFLGAGLLVLGLALSFEYLCATPSARQPLRRGSDRRIFHYESPGTPG